MATKTRQIAFECIEASIVPGSYKTFGVKIDGPNMDALFESIDKDDIIAWVESNIDVADIYPQSTLENWAESEGYVKAETKND